MMLHIDNVTNEDQMEELHLPNNVKKFLIMELGNFQTDTSTHCDIPTDNFLNTVLVLVLGTYMSLSMVHYLTMIKRNKTVIDKLILSEQTVNLLGGLYHISMLLSLGLPPPMAGILRNTPFSVFVEMVAVFAFFHRAISGCGIAGLRQVIRDHFRTVKLF